jgi:hypothetical protein
MRTLRALLLLAALPFLGAWTHAVNCGESPPSWASAVGFTACTDSYNPAIEGLTPIDTGNTGKAGFKWYLLGYFGSPSTLSADLSISSGRLEINSTNAGAGWTTGNQSYRSRIVSMGFLNGSTATFPNSGNDVQGRTIPPGGYYETCMAFDSSSAGATSEYGWPASWLPGLTGVMSFTQDVSGTDYGELDFFEAETNGTAGTIHPSMTLWDLITNGSNGWSQTSFNNNAYLSYFAGLTYTSTTVHCMGTLWMTTAQNAGTGYFQRYVDGVHVTAGDCSYSSTTTATCGLSSPNPTGGLFSMEVGNHVWILDGSYLWPNYITSVRRWSTCNSC